MLYLDVLHPFLVHVQLIHDHERALVPVVRHDAASGVYLLLDLRLEAVRFLDRHVLQHAFLVYLALKLLEACDHVLSEVLKILIQVVVGLVSLVADVDEFFLLGLLGFNLQLQLVTASLHLGANHAELLFVQLALLVNFFHVPVHFDELVFEQESRACGRLHLIEVLEDQVDAIAGSDCLFFSQSHGLEQWEANLVDDFL